MHAREMFDSDVRHSFSIEDIARWTGGEWTGDPPPTITGFSIDTRTLKPGDLFIAIRGEQSDGHAYIAQAMSRGAAAVMVQDAASLNGLCVASLVVQETRRALLDLARGYRRTLRCRMIAVTGSVGKTTVKELIADMMSAVGSTARTRGNWNNDLGLPLSLLAAPPSTEFGVFEVGMNHPGELDPLCELLAPDLGVVTCVGPVHIENFENEAGIAQEKAAVYRGLRGQGIAVLNADDAHAASLRYAAAAGNRIIEVSARTGADLHYRRLDPACGRFALFERETGETEVFTASLPGEYFVTDAALAAAAARALGAPWPAIRQAIEQYQPLAMRWNRTDWSGVHIVNDAYNANPVSLRAAIRAFLEEPVKGQRWLVLAGMLELGDAAEAMHRETGAFIAGLNCLHLVAVGARGAWLAAGALAAGMPAAQVYAMPDHAAAAECLAARVRPGDAVLFKASRGEAVERVFEEWKKLPAAS